MRTSGVFAVHHATDTDLERMKLLMSKYKDAPMDFADASLVAAAENLRTNRIFTFDKHFLAYRISDVDAFDVIG